MKVGMIGLGPMGRGIAKNVLREFESITIPEHRAKDAVEELRSLGASVTSIEGVVDHSSHVLLCLSNGNQVNAILNQNLSRWKTDQVVIDVTTLSKQESLHNRAFLKELGVDYIDAPVIRGPKEAQFGTLVTLLGLVDQFENPRVKKIVSSYSETIHYFGSESNALVAKLLNNYVTCVTATVLVDVIEAARKNHVDLHKMTEILMSSAARSGTLEKMVIPILGEDYKGHLFSVDNAIKDLFLVSQIVGEQDSDLASAAASKLSLREHSNETVLSELLKPIGEYS
jgi:3-hydroxyisobutyrate dehydrogenase-like beta-hydroxyacid dehydrogenase